MVRVRRSWATWPAPGKVIQDGFYRTLMVQVSRRPRPLSHADPASKLPGATGLPSGDRTGRITHEARPLVGYYTCRLVHFLWHASVPVASGSGPFSGRTHHAAHRVACGFEFFAE